MALNRELVACGLFRNQASAATGSVATGLTATGTTQATALLLTSAINGFGTVGGSSGCRLPTGASLGDAYVIYNGGSSSLSMYPPLGGTINGGSTNAAVALAAGDSATIYCTAKTGLTWLAVSNATSSAAASGTFTTLAASGQISSTVASGTAPLSVLSTTQVQYLNADLLDGKDWTAPGTIGGATPAPGNFTTVTTTGPIAAFGAPLVTTQPGALTSVAISALTTTAVAALTTTGVASFLTDQVQALSTAQVAALCANNDIVATKMDILIANNNLLAAQVATLTESNNALRTMLKNYGLTA